MVSASVTPDLDILDAIADTAKESPKRMEREYLRQAKGIEVDMLAELQIDPQPASDFYPLPWTSERQHGYVMAKLRREGGPPSKRSGRLLSSYRVLYRPVENGLEWVVENTAPQAQWVIGDSAQPMFLLIGWVQFAPVVAKYREEANDRLIDTWAKVSMPKKRK